MFEGKCRSVFACELDGIAGNRQIGRDIDLHECDDRRKGHFEDAVVRALN